MLEYRNFTFEDVSEAINGRVYSSENTVVIPHIGYPSSRLHSHDFYEIEIFLSGGGEYTINGEHRRFEKGSLMYLAPSSYHSFLFDKAPHYEILSIRLNYIHTAMCEELFGDATGFCVALPERAVASIVADAENIYEQKKHVPQPYMEQYVCGTLKRMLSGCGGVPYRKPRRRQNKGYAHGRGHDVHTPQPSEISFCFPMSPQDSVTPQTT